MKRPDDRVLTRFHRALVDEIRRDAPEYLEGDFTVAEIYQSLVPYRTHRDRIGVEINGDYEDALMRLLAGDGDYLELESEPAKEQIRRELNTVNPNTGLYREFAAVGVRLNRDKVPASEGESSESSDAELPLLADDEVEALAPTPTSRSGAEDLPEASAAPPESPEKKSAPAVQGTETATAPSPPESTPPSPNQPGGAPMTEAAAPIASSEIPSACPDCGGGLPERDSLRFCPHCGTNVHLTACGECGEVLERSWKFCVACGTAADG